MYTGATNLLYATMTHTGVTLRMFLGLIDKWGETRGAEGGSYCTTTQASVVIFISEQLESPKCTLSSSACFRQ